MWVARPRLEAQLATGLAHTARLALVCAPAGFGKSTLGAAWVVTLTVPVAWLSLDAQDNDPLQFLTYLLPAIQRACHAGGDRQIAAFPALFPATVTQGGTLQGLGPPSAKMPEVRMRRIAGPSAVIRRPGAKHTLNLRRISIAACAVSRL